MQLQFAARQSDDATRRKIGRARRSARAVNRRKTISFLSLDTAREVESFWFSFVAMRRARSDAPYLVAPRTAGAHDRGRLEKGWYLWQREEPGTGFKEAW